MSEPRRLYRDPRHGMIGGVCAGLAEYLRADPTVVRVAFAVVAVLGIVTRGVLLAAAVLTYAAMWFLVPKRPDGEEPPPLVRP